ncbi:hypothetical protein NAB46_18370 [Proteus mirabilis]|nr:hypothetical protein [Proteus mirabilis]
MQFADASWVFRRDLGMPAWPGGGGCCWVPLIPSPWLGVWYTLGWGWWIWVDRLGVRILPVLDLGFFQ